MEKKSNQTQKEDVVKGKIKEVSEGGVWTVLGFGLYFMILTVVFLYIVVKIWPTADGAEGPIVLFRLIKAPASAELRLIMIVALVGGLGSLIHAMTSCATYVGNKQFKSSWTWWYILRPFIGMPLALIFYFVIRGGFFTMAAETEAVSPFGMAGLSGLVGMFSKQAIDKLGELFQDLFKTAEDAKRKDKL